MCWMTLRRQNDALAHGIIDIADHEQSNGHSWGYAFAEDGEIHVEKGVGTIPRNKLMVPAVDNAIVHTRFATTGAVNETNAHPFRIVHGGETVAALAHNGTWHGAPRHEKYSDTWMMARLFEQNLNETDDFEQALLETTDRCGETLTVLRQDGTGYVYAGRFSITHDGNGVVASSGHDPLTEGLYRLETDGEFVEVEPEQRTIAEYNRR